MTKWYPGISRDIQGYPGYDIGQSVTRELWFLCCDAAPGDAVGADGVAGGVFAAGAGVGAGGSGTSSCRQKT